MPAHDRHPEWRAPDNHSTDEWRFLNGEADVGASGAAQRLWDRYLAERNATGFATATADSALLRQHAGNVALLDKLRNAHAEVPRARHGDWLDQDA